MAEALRFVYLVWVNAEPWAVTETAEGALDWWDRMERAYANVAQHATIVVEEINRQTGHLTRLARSDLEHRAAR